LSKETRVPAIPFSSDPAVKALKEALEVRLGRRGNELDRAITVRELYENGVINLKGMPAVYVGGNNSITPVTSIGDTSPPPIPTNVTVNGAFVGVLISWDEPARTDLSAEIWRNDSDDRTTAVLTGVASGNIYSDLVGHGQTYYYWVRFVSEAGVIGPFNDIDGVQGETSEKISDIIDDLSDAIGQTHLSTSLSTEIDAIQINSDDISAEILARTTGDGVLQGNIDAVSAVVTTHGTNITGNANALGALVIRVTDNEGDISVNATDITALESTVNNPSTGVSATASGLSSLSTTVSTQGNNISAIATDVTTLNTTVGSNSASIQSHTGSINGLSAEQFVKVDVNGNVAGYGIYGTSTYNEFAVNADVFKIANGSSSIQPFVVITGAGLTIAANGTEHGDTNEAWKDANHPDGIWFAPGTYMDTAYISDASIDVAKIGNLTVDFLEATGSITSNNVDTVTLDAGQITTGFIDAGRIDATLLNVEDMNLTGVLQVVQSPSANGAISWGKTAGNDFLNTGMFFGVENGALKFNMGSPQSYMYFDGTYIQLVNHNTVAVSMTPTSQYTTAGIYTRNLGAHNIGETITVKALGGGAGGGAYQGQSRNSNNVGQAGEVTTVKIKKVDGSTRSTFTVNGGAASPTGHAAWANYGGSGGPSHYAAEWAVSYDKWDYGGEGESVSQGGIFVGTGGARTRSKDGTHATGCGAGGGGTGDSAANYTGYPGLAGQYSTTSYTVVSNTDYIEITVGDGGRGGIANNGSNGGDGSSGAAEITVQ